MSNHDKDKEQGVTKMGNDHCPACNYTCSAAGTMDGKPGVPNPGDVSICLNCGEFLEYASDMALIKLTSKTLNELDPMQLSEMHNHKKYILRRGPIPKHNG